MRSVDLWLQQSDEFILQALSTTPDVEPPHTVMAVSYWKTYLVLFLEITTTITYCSLLYIFRYEHLWSTCKTILFLLSLCLGTIARCIIGEMNILAHGLRFDIKNVFIYWQSTTKSYAKSMFMGLLVCFVNIFKTPTLRRDIDKLINIYQCWWLFSSSNITTEVMLQNYDILIVILFF